MNTLLELQQIGRSFDLPGDNGKEVIHKVILDQVNLQVAEGEFLAILGPSGSGKSTLLRIIAGLIPATTGTVSYLGQPVQGINAGVGMVFQSFALFPWLTVLENVMLGLENKPLSEAEKQEKSMQVLDVVGLDGFENAYPKELSGGMRQRVGIGRALVSEPDILLMDEAFSALDVLTAENLRRDLLELWLEKKIPTKAIILVTHGIEEAVYMADRAVILSSGPATVIENLSIDIPRWRDRKSPEFLTYVDRIYSLMTKKRNPEKIPLKKKDIKLPLVRAGALTGFLELLEDRDIATDLYKMAGLLMMDIEDFFPLVEASDLLQFTRVVEGDIELTDQGRFFAQATVLERKEIFRQQLLSSIPMVKQMLQVLRAKANHEMNRDFFLDILMRTMGERDALEQLDLLIGWERYAELIAYDQDREVISLEDGADTIN
ncbi:MAG: nitrate/sulfonate/bicarbonate ABC transporter ATP-binding protein [Selenomonas sp.]|nr:nitrate/sulfonate/bicarbonate ABC transporter ATP-binding protein [Selenomonas sp.]